MENIKEQINDYYTKNPTFIFKETTAFFFESCNSMIGVPTEYGTPRFSAETKEEYLNKSRESGLIPDIENNVYVRAGYGALISPVHFHLPMKLNKNKEITTEQLIKEIGKEKREYIMYKNLFEFFNVAGLEVSIGPGGYLDEGYHPNHSLYCSNYMDIINRYNEASLNQSDVVKK